MSARSCSRLLAGLILGGLLLSIPHAFGSPVVAQTEEEIAAASPVGGGLDSPLGMLVADAIRFQTRAEVALIPNGMLGVGIPKGPVTEAHLLRVLAYPDDRIIVVTMQGAELARLLEQSLERHPYPSGRFLQISGATVEFGERPDPEGARVRRVTVGGLPLVGERSYKVAVPLPLAQGFLGYPRVGRDHTETGSTLAQALLAYARAQRLLRPPPDQRFRLVP